MSEKPITIIRPLVTLDEHFTPEDAPVPHAHMDDNG